MATTNYHTVSGKLIGETTGGQRASYLTDALGPVQHPAPTPLQRTKRYARRGTPVLLTPRAGCRRL